MDPADVADRIRRGRRHLRFVLELYDIQIKGGRYFLHEHPSGALSWRDPVLMRLKQRSDVECVTMDQCQYGLLTPGPDGALTPAR